MMKKLLFLMILLLAPILCFPKDELQEKTEDIFREWDFDAPDFGPEIPEPLEENVDWDRVKIKMLCSFLIEQNFLTQDHLCYGAINNENIVDELLKRGILEHLDAFGGPSCVIPPQPLPPTTGGTESE